MIEPFFKVHRIEKAVSGMFVVPPINKETAMQPIELQEQIISIHLPCKL